MRGVEGQQNLPGGWVSTIHRMAKTSGEKVPSRFRQLKVFRNEIRGSDAGACCRY